MELRFNHRKTLGTTEDGTIELREDAVGLHASAVVQDEELAEKARNKELRGWSFGFVATANAGKERPRAAVTWTILSEGSIHSRQDSSLYCHQH